MWGISEYENFWVSDLIAWIPARIFLMEKSVFRLLFTTFYFEEKPIIFMKDELDTGYGTSPISIVYKRFTRFRCHHTSCSEDERCGSLIEVAAMETMAKNSRNGLVQSEIESAWDRLRNITWLKGSDFEWSVCISQDGYGVGYQMMRNEIIWQLYKGVCCCSTANRPSSFEDSLPWTNHGLT